MKLLAVSGACRKVGKTRVALQLCEILGDTVYAKIGHGVKSASKPENFFTNVDDFLKFISGLSNQRYQYCIVESNNHAVCKLADVRIFIGAPASVTDIRDDAAELEQGADIVIAPKNAAASDAKNMLLQAEAWHLFGNIPAEKIAILEKLFRDQQQYLSLQ